ncbi:protein-methionine-sulfoxide reductase heme-binding subunit MsrQ [Oryzifoliimicrobium ureilyticus]|uniref:protein-methionine-sulfoxide reductase heme-binding subunit MsrQ n=1 Tax=Oryzifoliimicrobium ureilyticus TaxID=3113724 RepID=UPI003076624D
MATTGLAKRWQSSSVWLLYAVGLVPAAWTFYLGVSDQLGADPVKTFELFLGTWTIRFLIITLMISPLRELLGVNLIRYRRALGLLTFYYAVMHFTVYLVLDQAMDINAVIEDVLKRPFIMFGMAGLVLLIPLAVTSNSFAIRRLGGKWNQLHRLTYLVAALGVVHYALSTKVFGLEQSIYILMLIALILYRSYRPIAKSRKRSRGRLQARTA